MLVRVAKLPTVAVCEAWGKKSCFSGKVRTKSDEVWLQVNRIAFDKGNTIIKHSSRWSPGTQDKQWHHESGLCQSSVEVHNEPNHVQLTFVSCLLALLDTIYVHKYARGLSPVVAERMASSSVICVSEATASGVKWPKSQLVISVSMQNVLVTFPLQSCAWRSCQSYV